jgi:dienelactone hydrolase
MRNLIGLALIVTAAAQSPVAAQPPSAPAGAPAAPAQAFVGTGRYPAISEAAAGLATHTVYRPRDLSQTREPLPVVLFANGACANDNRFFRPFLTELASRGYVVIAIGPYDPAPLVRSGAPEPAAAAPTPGQDPTQSSQLVDALAWALAENARPGSALHEKLAVRRVAVMGQSCGGLQALDVSSDPRVSTSVILNSGIYVRPGGRSGVRISKDKLRQLHAPIAYFIGGTTDIAYPNAADDFERIDKVPVLFANLPLGHSGNYSLPQGGPFAPVVAAWLDWRLKGDRGARRVFAGPNCGLCGDPAWTVRSKHLE